MRETAFLAAECGERDQGTGKYPGFYAALEAYFTDQDLDAAGQAKGTGFIGLRASVILSQQFDMKALAAGALQAAGQRAIIQQPGT